MTRTFLTVSLPLAVPGIVASALLVFLYSLDEFTGTLLVGAPFVTTLPVYMYTASVGYELQIASVTAIVLMVPGRGPAAPAGARAQGRVPGLLRPGLTLSPQGRGQGERWSKD